MQINLSSNGYHIISTGMTFLFQEDKDLKIDVTADNGYHFMIKMEFKEDDTHETRIEGDSSDDAILLQCFNFNDNGTGTCWPVKIGVLDEKNMYLMFWSYLNGDKGKNARSVQYTIFLEK